MHDGMDTMTMTMQLLPTWLRVVWVVALGAVVVLHVGHAWAMPGQRRWWHVGHTAMAVGMALMYALPRMLFPGLYRVGLVLFALLTVTVAAVTVALRRHESTLNPLWVFSAVEMLVMTYMLLPPSVTPSWLTYLLIGYLSVQIVGWAFGLWDRLPVFRRPVLAGSAPDTGATIDTLVRDTDGGERSPALLPADPHPEASTGPVVGLTAHSSAAVHVTLAVMAASMAYMLAVM